MTEDNPNLSTPEAPNPPESAPPEFSTPEEPPLPEDIRVPWGWLDVVLLVPVTIGGLFLCAILILLGLALFGVPFARVQNSPSAWGLVSVCAQALLDVALLGYLAMQTRGRYHLPFWRTMGWRPFETGNVPRSIAYVGLITGGCLLAFAVGLGNLLFPPKVPLPIDTILQGHATALVFMLTAVLIAPAVEETVFRGYIYPVAARSFGIRGGIFLTGTLFGLLHGAQLWPGWWQIVLLIFVGIVFTFARAKARTVIVSYVLHVSYNSIQVVGFLIDTHGLRHFPGIH